MPQYFVRFPSETMRPMAMPMLAADPERYRPFEALTQDQILIADLSDEQRKAAESNGATVYEDVQFHPVGPPNPLLPAGLNYAYWERAVARPSDLALMAPAAAAPWQTRTLTDVLKHTGVPAAWAKKARGQGVTIGIVDTGVSSAMPEFPGAKRSPFSRSFAYSAGPWADTVGHGSMCACAAAATSAAGGRYDGVAPDATLLSARTNLLATDIYKLYDWVLTKKRSGELPGPVVMSNSYGMYTCSAPAGLPQDHPYRQIVLDAVAAGIVVVFAAGNNHVDVCHADPTKCSPNSIWGANSLDEVLSVGTVNWNNQMDAGQHGNSSRGPGQWAKTHKKPDCVAPTYGEIVWGSGYRVMEWWGTSGACPQVAGLAALLLSIDPSLTPQAVGDIIRDTCTPLPLPHACAGAGVINCAAAVADPRVKAKKPKPKTPTTAKKAQKPRKPKAG
ncbi:S8 family serine peptidase [Gemmata sp. JC673]|uniref:S8 family serine peptidase n=1 Tax=Gemmata algarum TaxID=2975278 RepID=A0ABU5F7D7_9BACT|nr:S8 family serine peptidase [Gemmata algarum]MDY3563515.1 S8 family serine peptidase [Gemmata algarum]